MDIRLQIQLAPDTDEADKIITAYYHFETVREKIAFLKGMFGVSTVGNPPLDEATYHAMLNTVLFATGCKH